MAIRAEYWKLPRPDRAEANQSKALAQDARDADARYVPHALSEPQFTTLYAIIKRMISRLHEAIAAPSHVATGLDASLVSRGATPAPADASAYPLGLDALDDLSRANTGYAFAELTPELQDILLDMVASGDLTVRDLDLARWLDGLRSHAAEARKPDAA